VCCRVAPLQKAGVVELIKRKAKEMTLAIGDGAHTTPLCAPGVSLSLCVSLCPVGQSASRGDGDKYEAARQLRCWQTCYTQSTGQCTSKLFCKGSFRSAPCLTCESNMRVLLRIKRPLA
jgi:hypothetical protein